MDEAWLRQIVETQGRHEVMLQRLHRDIKAMARQTTTDLGALNSVLSAIGTGVATLVSQGTTAASAAIDAALAAQDAEDDAGVKTALDKAQAILANLPQTVASAVPPADKVDDTKVDAGTTATTAAVQAASDGTTHDAGTDTSAPAPVPATPAPPPPPPPPPAS